MSRMWRMAKRKFKTMKETRVYLVNVEKTHYDVTKMNNEDFMTEAERQGSVYSLKGFEKDFNEEIINSYTDIIKII